MKNDMLPKSERLQKCGEDEKLTIRNEFSIKKWGIP
jgi:hypothetical protein